MGVFSRVVIFHNMPISHTVSLALFAYVYSDPATPLLSCTCLCNKTKWCLPSFVRDPPLAQCLLLWCFLLNMPICIVRGEGGVAGEMRHVGEQKKIFIPGEIYQDTNDYPHS